jgi:hypothetical protein
LNLDKTWFLLADGRKVNLNQDSVSWLQCLRHFTEVLRTSPYLDCLCAWVFLCLYSIFRTTSKKHTTSTQFQRRVSQHRQIL